MTPYTLVEVYRCFGGMYCCHLQSQSVKCKEAADYFLLLAFLAYSSNMKLVECTFL
jgi:hypothetical protein